MSLIHSVLIGAKVAPFAHLDVDASYLGANEAEVYDYIHTHVTKYGTIPAVETVEHKFGLQVSAPAEPLKYYEDAVKKKHLHGMLKRAVVSASTSLRDMNPEKALDSLMADVMALVRVNHGSKIMDFREARESLLGTYKQTIMEGDDYALTFGWEFLDDMTGGIGGGDVLSIVGRPAMGKTFLLLFVALNAWKKHGKAVVFVSMEMKPLVIFQRLAAMYTRKNLTHLMKAGFITQDYKDFFHAMMEVKESNVPFYVIDGALSSTAEDIWMLSQQLTPDVLFIDGAYLVRHKDTYLSKPARIEANCELFKNLATELDIPACLSYQLNREATKVKTSTGDSTGLEHIAGSDAIGQLSSIVLGMLQSDTVETLQSREVSVLKGRSGEQGTFKINWDFSNMDFSEWKEEDFGDLNAD